MRLNPDHQAHGQQFIEKSQKVWSHSLITVFGCVRIYPYILRECEGWAEHIFCTFPLKRPFVLPLLKSWLNYWPFNSISINISQHRYRLTVIELSHKNFMIFCFNISMEVNEWQMSLKHKPCWVALILMVYIKITFYILMGFFFLQDLFFFFEGWNSTWLYIESIFL